ncbi:interleukin-17 receptor A [Dendropsophus ebraccatus]|uniref:interleukin-17 receptor A n=1 Tax=Dendropsophus ebraccatus TaxID=150705 RepID=UPI00383220F6
MALTVRLVLLSGLLCAAGGLRIIHSPDISCSQPGIQCSVLNSDCLDLSWIQPFKWTPSAPSQLEVTAGVGQNKSGYRVPVLQINWTVNIDASIQYLQGAEVSVLELATSRTRCVQFQFGNPFPGQRDHNNQPWKFFYNLFEVNPGNQYQISVQHLPKQKQENRIAQEFTVPACSDSEMTGTDTCCSLGHCWNHYITLTFNETHLIVTFTPQRDAYRYGVRVDISPLKTALYDEILDLPQGATTERRKVIISNPERHDVWWYNVSVWPYMPPCYNDCVRHWYAPPSPPPPTPPPQDLSRQVKVWPIAAAAIITVFAITVILLGLHQCMIPPDPKIPILPPLLPPPPVKQKVWLVYSADHKLYVDAVIKLADFLQVSWGLEVILDLHHSLDIGIKGPMDWLIYQKEQIDKTNGIILILCSKGAQAKWKAKQIGQEPSVPLPEDVGNKNFDLFTMALHLFCADFQRTSPYGRYVVAYFSELSDAGDVPAPFNVCSQHALTENLQDLWFRIQRIERRQPSVQYNVNMEGPSYRHLVKAIERCRSWQETHPDWFVIQCSSLEEEEETIEKEVVEDEDGHELTRRNYPHIRQPEAPISKMTPIIVEPDAIRSVNPSLIDGPPSVHILPRLNVERSSVVIQQPCLNTECRASYIQQPFLAHVDQSLPICNERLGHINLSIPSDQDVHPEDLSEAQIRFFSQSILEDEHMNPEMFFYDAEASPSAEDPRAARLARLEESLLTVNDRLLHTDLSVPSDQGVQSMDMMEAQEKLFYRHPAISSMVLDGESSYGSEGCLGEEDESVYERLLHMGLSIPQSQQPEDLEEAQKKFFFQNIDIEDLPPELFYDEESPHRPLMVDADKPLPVVSDPILQTQPPRHGQGPGSMELGETQKNWFTRSGQEITPETADDLDIYEERAVTRRKNKVHCHSADLGYGTLC